MELFVDISLFVGKTMFIKYGFMASWHSGKVIYEWLRANVQAWVLRENFDDESSPLTCTDALLLLNIGQSNRSPNFIDFEFDQFFDDGAAEAELYCDFDD